MKPQYCGENCLRRLVNKQFSCLLYQVLVECSMSETVCCRWSLNWDWLKIHLSASGLTQTPVVMNCIRLRTSCVLDTQNYNGNLLMFHCRQKYHLTRYVLQPAARIKHSVSQSVFLLLIELRLLHMTDIRWQFFAWQNCVSGVNEITWGICAFCVYTYLLLVVFQF